MSSFFRRLFGRSKIDTARRPHDIALPAAPDPDDLFDWSPRARPEGKRPKPATIEEAPADERRSVSDAPAVAPISEALSQFHRPATESTSLQGRGPVPSPTRTPDTESSSTRPPSVPPVRGPGTPSPTSPAPPPTSKPAQIRLLMGDGTVVEVSGDPELERMIGYLADNLLAPRPEPRVEAAPPAPPLAPVWTAPGADYTAPAVLASADIQEVVPDAVEAAEVDHSRGWPHMRLVFTDGSEATLPPDQEIVDRLAYVVANLLPARPTT